MPANTPPRVVLILRHFTVGGLERVLLSHVRVLLSAGYRVTVCVLEPGRDNALVTELPSDAELVVAPAGRLKRIIFLSTLTRDTVVLLQFGDGRLYPSIRPALAQARKVIRFCHSDYSHLRSPNKNRLDRILSHTEDFVVAVGGRSTRFLLDDVGVAADKVTTLPNATEPPLRPAAQPPWEWALDPYLVAVQSLYPHKGHDALLHGFAQVVERSQRPVLLTIIGDGDQTIPLRQLAERLGITNRIIWLGGVWRRDLVDTILSGATGFVSMSRYEGVPISILEARQHGLPFILTDIPGHRDGAGTSPSIFVPVDDIDTFAEAALNLLTQGAVPPEHRTTYGELAREWDSYVNDFLEIVHRAARPRTAQAAYQDNSA